MQDLDQTPLVALANKWDNPSSSGYLGPVESMNRATIVTEQTALLPTSLPSRIRYHTFELVHNAVPTRAREKWRGHALTCPLCGGGPETIDHLHRHCQVGRKAVASIFRHYPDRSGLQILHTATTHD